MLQRRLPREVLPRPDHREVLLPRPDHREVLPRPDHREVLPRPEHQAELSRPGSHLKSLMSNLKSLIPISSLPLKKVLLLAWQVVPRAFPGWPGGARQRRLRLPVKGRVGMGAGQAWGQIRHLEWPPTGRLMQHK